MSTIKVGLTGGIASGKTTAQHFFEHLGVKTIDHDLVAKEVVSPGTPGLNQLVKKFGSRILTNKALNRAALKDIIFKDSAAKKSVENIIHPLVFARSQQLLNLYCNEVYTLIVSPLLIESGSAATMDALIVVTLNRELQLQRLLQRDGMTVELANAIIDSQATPAQRIHAADYLLENNKDTQWLQTQVLECHQSLLDRFTAG